MATGSNNKPLKSVTGKPAMRSRGFLSRPGGQLTEPVDGNEAQSQTTAHHRSRGKRHVTSSAPGKPSSLAAPNTIRRYTLEDE